MKSSELRIGNKVQDKHGRTETITFITATKIGVVFGEYHIDDLFPIPLTEEWLLKFGFEKETENEFVQWWQKGWIKIYYEYYNKENLFFTLVPFKTNQNKFNYVHQLQNLYYALTGEELCIKVKQ